MEYPENNTSQNQNPMINPEMYFNQGGTHSQSIIQMTNTREEVGDLKLSLQSAEIINNKLFTYGDPLMNDKGINSVISQIKSLVHRITIMSNLDEDEIRKLMLSASDGLIMDLMTNRITYGIKKSYDRTKIVRMWQGVAYTCIKRAIYGDDKKLWGKIQHDMTTTVVNQGQQGSQPWYKKWSPFR